MVQGRYEEYWQAVISQTTLLICITLLPPLVVISLSILRLIGCFVCPFSFYRTMVHIPITYSFQRLIPISSIPRLIT